MKKLSIVIVNFNAGKHLEDCLESLYSNKHCTDFETVVVDNNSTDGSVEHIQEQFSQIRLIKNSENSGFAKANNIAIRKTESEYILLLNSDTIVQPDSVDLLTVVMENNPKIGVLSCQLQNKNGNLQESFSKVPDIFNEFLRKNIHNRFIENRNSFWGRHLYAAHQERHDVDWVSGSCMMIRREALQDSGLFDENYFMYFEDVDLCLQMKKKGWSVCYTPICQIIHIGGVSAANNPQKINLEYRKSQLYFYKKHHKKSISNLLKLYIFIKVFSNMSALFVQRLSGIISPSVYQKERVVYSHMLSTLKLFRR